MSTLKEIFRRGKQTEALHALASGDFRNGDRYYISKLSVDDVEYAFVVNSRRDIQNITQTKSDISTLENGKEIKNLNIAEYGKWSSASISKFLDEAIEPINFPNIHKLIINALRPTMSVPEPVLTTFALAVVGSYFTSLSPTVPFFHVRGPKGSGKSSATSAVVELSYNGAILPDGATPPAVFRIIAQGHSVVQMDDAEMLYDETPSLFRKNILPSYKRKTAIRPIVIGHSVQKFNLFQMKYFTSINPAEPVLQSRMLTVKMQHADKSFAELDPVIAQEIRDALYAASMSTDVLEQVRQAIADSSFDPRYNSRVGEITLLLRAIAKLSGGAKHLHSFIESQDYTPVVPEHLVESILKRIMSEYETFVMSHFQSEMYLCGLELGGQDLSDHIEKSGLAESVKQVMIHGYRPSLYAPTKKGEKLLESVGDRSAREYCLQAAHKLFVPDRCTVCPFNGACAIQDKNLQEDT